MKKYNTLSFQIWKIFSIFMLLLSIAFSFLFYSFMSNFIKDQIFQGIESNQDNAVTRRQIYNNTEKNEDETEYLNLNNMIVSKIEISKNPNPEILEIKIEELLDAKTRIEIENDAKLQIDEFKRYSKSYQGKE